MIIRKGLHTRSACISVQEFPFTGGWHLTQQGAEELCEKHVPTQTDQSSLDEDILILFSN